LRPLREGGLTGTGYPTLAERKEARVQAMRVALDALRASLSDYGRRHGGRFLLYGSAARGDLRYDSDVDLLLDFPATGEADAWRFAEEACWALRLRPDIRAAAWCRPEFRDRVAEIAVSLP
jgi:predicted nucleotidyltransferase